MQPEVVIVGAGPYGLSLAANLRAQGVLIRVFGKPMETWLCRMPAGMALKSEGFASNLADFDDSMTLGRYCRDQGVEYRDSGLPVKLETFQSYGLAFQQRYVPDLDTRMVVGVRQQGKGFQIELDDGETFSCARVVLAVGISHYAHRPESLGHLPSSLASHTEDHTDLARFRGKRVAVVGAGASAFDTFKLLLDHGCDAELIARTGVIRFHAPPSTRARRLIDRLRAPMSGLGPGWKSRLCTDAPLVFHAMPRAFRHKVVQRHLGPAPCWWTNDETVRKAATHLATKLEKAVARDDTLDLHLAGPSGPYVLNVDHVIAGTGYRVDLDRLTFLAPELHAAIRNEKGSPRLSRHFQASVPGLYFIGISAAASFGPLLRFAFGARYAARRLARHLHAESRAAPIPGGTPERQDLTYHASQAREAVDA